MILIVDNYDSFVHNIARYFIELGEDVVIKRNDEITHADLNVKAMVISPGPCAPQQAGQSMQLVKDYSGQLPILGICLGHQVIGEVFGATVTKASTPMHGDSSIISHEGTGIFEGLPKKLAVGRYHSLIVRDLENTKLRITAQSDDGEVMGLQHQSHPTFGVQFHPESILTEHGYAMLRNFLRVAA